MLDEDEEEELDEEQEEEEVSKAKEKSSERKLFYKKLLTKYGVFCALLTALFVVLAAATAFSRDSWKSGLREEIMEVLNKNGLNTVTVGEWLKVKNALAVSFSLYDASASDGKASAAALVRVPTLWGFTAAVYLCCDGEWEFVDFSHISSPSSLQVKRSALSSQIYYWQNKLSKISSNVSANKDTKDTDINP